VASTVTLDIDTKIVSSDQRIWAVFPGLSRRFLNNFIDERVIFLDTPDINLNLVALRSIDTLRKHVAMSLAWKSFYLGHREDVPSSIPDHYDPPRTPSFSAAVGNVRSMFARMNSGDLVLLAGRSIYEPVLVGEVDGAFNPDDYTHIDRYPGAAIPMRRVHWLPVSNERRFLSKDLSMLLSNRKAVVNIDRRLFGEQVFRIAYGDYVDKEASRYIFEGNNYNNQATDAIPGIRLIAYFCAAFSAEEQNRLSEFFALDIDDSIETFFDRSLLSSFELDFRSPGEYVLFAKNAALALTVALLVSATADGLSLTAARQAEIENSRESDTQISSEAAKCPPQIENAYRNILNAINLEKYEKACKLNKAAQNGVGLSVRIKRHGVTN
jgi:hypothetical protein